MAKTTSNEELAQRIEQLVLEHIAESRRVAEEALERAFASATPTPPKARSATTSKRRTGGRRRPPREVAALGEKLYAAVCAHPGEGMAVLAKEVSASVRELHRPMTHLKNAGRVRSVGSRNHTRYFPMATDAAAE